jgi:hypothetical protein
MQIISDRADSVKYFPLPALPDDDEVPGRKDDFGPCGDRFAAEEIDAGRVGVAERPRTA